MANELNGYELSRNWFDFCFENPEKTNTNQTALYFFIIEHCNRLGWKDKFGLPTTMTMEALSIKSYNTYKQALNMLIEHGFIKMVEKSKNQYSANIIALSKNNKAHTKALDKAFIKHTSKQSESTHQSNDSIDKQITINKEQESKEDLPAPVPDLSKSNLFRQPIIPTKEKIWEVFKSNGGTKEMADKFWDSNEATGWYNRGCPITNFKNLVPGFIATWKSFDKTAKKDLPAPHENKPIDGNKYENYLKPKVA